MWSVWELRHRPAIELGARVVTTQPLPEGIPAGTCGTVIGEAGWIQRRWRVRFDDGFCVNVPEYALDPARRRAASTAIPRRFIDILTLAWSSGAIG